VAEREADALSEPTSQPHAHHGGWAELLADAGHALRDSSTDIAAALDDIAQYAVSWMADGCAILLEEDQQDHLVPTTIRHHEQEAMERIRRIAEHLSISAEDARLARLDQEPQPARIVNINQYRRALTGIPHADEYLDRFGVSDLLIASLRSDGHPSGILALWRDRDGPSFTDEDRIMTNLLAGQISLAANAAATRDKLDKAERERDVATAMLDNLLETAPIGFTFHDPALRLLRTNHQIAPINGPPTDDAVGHHFDERLAELEPALMSQIQQVLDTGEPQVDIEVSGQARASPGVAYHWRASHYPVWLPNGELLGVSAIITDITDQIVADEELRESLQHAENLAEAEIKARHQAEQAVTIRDSFLSIASHELKTPLTTIKATAQLLDRRLRQPAMDIERIRGHATLLQREIERLATLVDDLLNATQIQRGRLALRPERVDLIELARQVLARFEYAPERTERHTFRFIAPERLPAFLDPGRIDQVFMNLISNALKYSPEGGEVRVVIQKAGDQAEISVIDHGMGMTREEQSRLFQPFARSAMIRQTISGSGLGLYIAARIIAQHGGTISVESEPDTGSIFQVCLPLTTSAERQGDDDEC
jgi:PAS domain S-box-containing protein